MTETTQAPKKAKRNTHASYEVISLPINRERLSPQLRALVTAIEGSIKDVDGKKVVTREEILAKWRAASGVVDGEKVYGSLLHQLLAFAFLDRMGNVSTKKVISANERKEKLLAMLAKLPESDRLELLAQLKG